jgi:hypothetical protein
MVDFGGLWGKYVFRRWCVVNCWRWVFLVDVLVNEIMNLGVMFIVLLVMLGSLVGGFFLSLEDDEVVVSVNVIIRGRVEDEKY